jgi:hypothetical protein
MSISYLEIVDVFGQRMQLLNQPAEPIQAIAALPLQPDAADTANAGKIFLPPRLLPPTRLWFRWPSAAFNPAPRIAPVIGGDFVEMNTHPATTPVCGWVVPNHLDLSQKANAVNEYATFGYTPQTLQEGWLQLKAAAKPEHEDL